MDSEKALQSFKEFTGYTNDEVARRLLSMFRGDWDQALRAACQKGVWLLVNVQDVSEFACKVLNRDIWSDETVREVVRSNFFFLQVDRDYADGARLRRYYGFTTYPAIFIVDPRTGEEVVGRLRAPDPISFLDSLYLFLDRNPSFEARDQHFREQALMAQQQQLQKGSVPKIRPSASPQLQTKMTPAQRIAIGGKVERRVTELKRRVMELKRRVAELEMEVPELKGQVLELERKVTETKLQTKMTPAKKNVIAIGKVKRRVTELKCSEIRWFYQKREDANWWTPFKGFDSMVLELAYRRKNGMALDEATKSHFESSPVPESSVSVLDSNYKVDEQMESIEAIYWGEDTMKITRGSWFYADTNQPVPVDFADIIEAHHLENFRDNVIPETPVFSNQILAILRWSDKEVRWNSVVDVFIAGQKGRMPAIRLMIRRKYPLRRSYKEEANPTEGKPHFSDLILVVHGIGQKGRPNSIAENTAKIREAVAQLMEKNYGSERRKPAILPVEWRSVLALDEGITDIVTLPRMKLARATLNSTLMDLMYYQSPLYRTELINGVTKRLNTIHTTFMENNPDFNGPISILGHSLGSVIAYDIITHWSPFLLYDHFVANAIAENITKSNVAEERKLLEDFQNSRKKMLELGGVMEQILIRPEERLKFRIKYLFCVGSPLAIFLIMRGADYKALIKPYQVDWIFNIFHPYDPVAYRLEPLFHENYRKIQPFEPGEGSTDDEELKRLIEEIPLERRLPSRIDFQVQVQIDGFFAEVGALFTSHFSYWTNSDVAEFLLNAIYPPPSPS